MRLRVLSVVIWSAPAPGGAAVTACALAVLAMGSSRKPNFSACLTWDPFLDHVNRCYLPLAVFGAAMGRRCAYISCVAVWIIPGRSPSLMRYRMSVCTAHDKPPRLPECIRKPRRRNRTAENVPPGTGKRQHGAAYIIPSYAMPRPRKKSVFTFCQSAGIRSA